MVVRMNRKNNLRWVLLIFITVLILLTKLFIDTRFYGHDTLFHAGNIIHLSKTISFFNVFGDNLISLSANSFGYGTWLFYPKFPHLFGSYIYLIFKNVYFSMNLVYFIISFLSGVVMYFLSKKLFSCSRVAFLSSLIYLTFSYHLCEIYIRDAFAENFMFLIIPMVFLSLYELKSGNYSKFYALFISGYVIGMYSHLVTMLFCTIFVFLFLIYYRKDFFVKEKLKCLIVSTFIVVGLVCPFLTNILQHKMFGDYVVFTENFSNRNNVVLNILPLESYFIHDKDFNYNNILVYFNYSTIILVVITFFLHLFKSYRKKFFETRKLLLYAILIFVMFISSEYFWQHTFDLFTMIQFPWRIMIFLCCVISLYAPVCFCYKMKNRKIYYLLYLIVVFIMIGEGVNNISYYGNDEYSFEEISESGAVMGWQLEYLPVKVVDMSINHYGDYLNVREYQFILSDSSVDLNIFEDSFPNIQFEVKNVDNYLLIEFPRIYYRGYALYDEKEEKISIFETDVGFLGAEISKDGIYSLKYVGTIYNRISNVIFLITIFGLFIWGGWFLWKRKKLLF